MNKRGNIVKSILSLMIVLILLVTSGCIADLLEGYSDDEDDYTNEMYTLTVGGEIETSNRIYNVAFDCFVDGVKVAYSNGFGMEQEVAKKGEKEKPLNFWCTADCFNKELFDKVTLKFYVIDNESDMTSYENMKNHKGEIPVKNKINISVNDAEKKGFIITGSKKNGYKIKLK